MVGVGASGSESNPTTVGNWNSQQQNLFSQLSQQLQAGMGSQVTAYPNQMYVPQTAQDTSYFNNVNNSEAARQAALTQIASGQLTAEQQASYSPETTQNYYNASIRDPALREFNQVTQPAIAEQYAGPGYWSSARADATAKASGDLATNLAASRAKLAYDDQTAMRAAQESALNRQTAAPNAYATNANMEGQAAQYQRQIQQEQMLSEYQRWMSGETINGVSNSAYNPYMQLIFQALGLTPITIATEGSSFGFNGGISNSGG